MGFSFVFEDGLEKFNFKFYFLGNLSGLELILSLILSKDTSLLTILDFMLIAS